MRASNDNKSMILILKGTIKGFIFAVLIFFILIAVFAIIISKTDVSDAVIQVMTLASLGISSFVSAFINQNKTKQRGIVIGSISATEIFLVIFIVALFGNNGVFNFLMLKKLIVILFAGLLGGILSANKKKKYK
ncbi:MAG: TIGR04086 family membrane protein [Clostridia bacterium]|nr:TIGR04086 family membrane protein [Clostridia bacterium]